jgi:hypothetical protein
MRFWYSLSNATLRVVDIWNAMAMRGVVITGRNAANLFLLIRAKIGL